MTTLLATAHRRLEAVRPYQPGSPAGRSAGKLSANESPLTPAPGVLRAIATATSQVNRYPDDRPLRQAIGAHEGVDEGTVIVTNGSDELCYLIATLLIEPGASVVLSDPSYQVNELVSRVHGADLNLVPLRRDGSHDLPALAARAQQAAVLWLPTPHNPTGVAVDPEELERLLQRVPPRCLIVLDEAYRSYTEPGLRPDCRRLLVQYPNLLVQRTFSKAYALAGLRIGYGIAAPELIQALDVVRPPFSVNALAVVAARAALADASWYDYARTLVIRERVRLEETLVELGITHFSSQANFVTFQPHDPALLQRALSAAGLVARDGATLGLPGWLRVSIGGPPQMAVLRSLLKRSEEQNVDSRTDGGASPPTVGTPTRARGAGHVRTA